MKKSAGALVSEVRLHKREDSGMVNPAKTKQHD
jgi:hypothetical protein